MEHYHEILQPVKEVVSSLSDRVKNWVLPVGIISEAFNQVQQESAKRTVQMFAQGQLFED